MKRILLTTVLAMSIVFAQAKGTTRTTEYIKDLFHCGVIAEVGYLMYKYVPVIISTYVQPVK
jgi:hypothetical protein